MTNHKLPIYQFSKIKSRELAVSFTGGDISSDGGATILMEADKKLGLTKDLAKLFPDGRDQSKVSHDIESMIKQRVYGIALGYEDLNDHDHLRKCPALQTIVGRLEDINRKKKLLRTIDKTINYLKGESNVKLEEIFEGFSEEKQVFYENYLVDYGVDIEVLSESKVRTKNWSKEDWLMHKKAMDQIHNDLIAGIEQGLDPADEKVQAIIAKHYALTAKIWVPDRNAYIGLGQLYGANADFVAFYDKLHPDLLLFLQKAMKLYAENNL